MVNNFSYVLKRKHPEDAGITAVSDYNHDQEMHASISKMSKA